MDMARRQPYAALAVDADPDLGFADIRALRDLAEFCETYQVRRLWEAGHSWAQIAAWAGVSAQALHKKHAARLETPTISNHGHRPRRTGTAQPRSR